MRISGLEVLYVVLGVLCLGVSAVIFLLWQDLTNRRGDATPNIAAAGASCGFAIAGGLSFVAAAVAHRSEG
jgi:hypothetical protein